MKFIKSVKRMTTARKYNKLHPGLVYFEVTTFSRRSDGTVILNAIANRDIQIFKTPTSANPAAVLPAGYPRTLFANQSAKLLTDEDLRPPMYARTKVSGGGPCK